MTWIDLGNPYPRSQADQYDLYLWETGKVKRLPAGTARTTPQMLEVLRQRRTVRHFGFMEDDVLGGFLWSACRARETWLSEMGFELEHRSAPSAGAIHPIHLIIALPNDPGWWLYEPKGHLLIELPEASLVLQGLGAEVLNIHDSPSAAQLLLVAEPGKTLAKYADGCSLVWRDAGVLLGVMALTAQALGLNFCPLGITGEPWAGSLSDQRKLAGVGVALLGSAGAQSSC